MVMMNMHDDCEENIVMVQNTTSTYSVSSDDLTIIDNDLVSSSTDKPDEKDKITDILAAAGPIGVAAATAVASTRNRRKQKFEFETSPSIRKRIQNRILRKLRSDIMEYSTRVGQQAIVLIASPDGPDAYYDVFGSKPLENVITNMKPTIVEELQSALKTKISKEEDFNNGLFYLPPLLVNGIPTPLVKMTQAHLRTFIPLMLKYSTGRGKPGWGQEGQIPPWWPTTVPWANVRQDIRNPVIKDKFPWTDALRQIVINCYKYHEREDLLPAYNDEDHKTNANFTYAETDVPKSNFTYNVTKVPQLNNNVSCTEVEAIHIVPGDIQLRNENDTMQISYDGKTVNASSTTQATLTVNGQFVLTDEDGRIIGILTLPTSCQLITEEPISSCSVQICSLAPVANM